MRLFEALKRVLELLFNFRRYILRLLDGGKDVLRFTLKVREKLFLEFAGARDCDFREPVIRRGVEDDGLGGEMERRTVLLAKDGREAVAEIYAALRVGIEVLRELHEC